ncbi:ATP-binding protein [Vitreimonas flagellata]|uniref:ATP-binding protein n=1 Tax=Vitreimonas flagellata TaxID=2560861 RepID=UPI001074E25E|nr:ATP-binding protein [Vitreimonas flagellata]
MTHTIFIGYRRDDSGDMAGRIHDRLSSAFGEAAVFKDVDDIPVGQDFGEHIRTVLQQCQIFLALIGPQWIDFRNKAGARCLDDENDWVRLEIEIALSLGLQVIPVLINATPMPKQAELPGVLAGLPALNAARVRRDPDFHKDVSMLVDALKSAIETRSRVQTEKLDAENAWVSLGESPTPRALADFIRKYPTSERADEAQAKIGEIEAVLEAYERLRDRAPLQSSSHDQTPASASDVDEGAVHDVRIASAEPATGTTEGAAALTADLRVRAAMDVFSGPFALWDKASRLVMWNAAYADLFKLDGTVLQTGANYDTIQRAAALANIRQERLDPAHPDVRVIELNTGQWVQLIERRAPDGGVISIGVDITALKRNEEELARNERRLSDALTRAESQEYRIKALARESHEERQRAEDASRAKTTFLANMSSELRSPLNAIIGFSEIMAKELFGPLGNEQYKQYSQDIFDSGNHLMVLINDILDLSKIEAGKLNLSFKPLDPMEVIEQVVRMMRRRAEEKGLSVLIDAEALPQIEADHRAIKQILLNLLSNAVKFTDTGAIMVHARATPTHLVIRVVDTGCGIAAEDLPKLARPFETVAGPSARPARGAGIGLGLALAKSLTEMHGGKLAIQSEIGRGTIVSVSFPHGSPNAPEPAIAAVA